MYRSSFARRSGAMSGPDQELIDQPGVCGVLGSDAAPRGRLLITDDRALPVLQQLAPAPPVQVINVFDAATRCRELIEHAAGWEAEPATAMICPNLAGIPTLSLPVALSLRPVRRTAADPPGGVPLEQAALACQRADPLAAGQSLPGFLSFLQSLPPSTRLLAALDEQGQVRATAGSSALGPDANAYFVSTDQSWRHQGIATAMTAAALGWARDTGARSACLDASIAGLSIYLRLGFHPVSPVSLFVRFS